MIRITIAALAVLVATTAFAEPISISSEKLKKAAAAQEIKDRAAAIIAAMGESAGFIVVVLDKSGSKEAGRILVKRTGDGYSTVAKVINDQAAKNTQAADKALTEVGVEVK